MIKRCPKCNTTNSEEAKFCYNCGYPLKSTLIEQDEPIKDQKLCPVCNTSLLPNAKFCHACGTPVTPNGVQDNGSNQGLVEEPTFKTHETTSNLKPHPYYKPPYSMSPQAKDDSSLFWSVTIILGIIILLIYNYQFVYGFLLTLSILPSILIILYFYKKDKEKEPLNTLMKAFVYGLLTIILALFLEIMVMFIISVIFDQLPKGLFSDIFLLFSFAFIVAAMVEEYMKYLVVKRMARDPNFNQVYDGIIYGITGALGFATLENIFYVLGGGSDSQFLIAFVRGILAVPMHAVTGGIIGYLYANNIYLGKRSEATKLLKLPILIHGTYNFNFLLFSYLFEREDLLLFLSLFLNALLLVISVWYLNSLVKESRGKQLVVWS